MTTTKKDLALRISEKLGVKKQLAYEVVDTLFRAMRESLIQGNRIEIRGFGSFSLHYRAPRIGRNPKTGEQVALSGKYVPHFKPGKELRERVNEGLQSEASSPESADDNLGAV